MEKKKYEHQPSGVLDWSGPAGCDDREGALEPGDHREEWQAVVPVQL